MSRNGDTTFNLVIVMEEAEKSLASIIKERSKNPDLIKQYMSRSNFRKICMDLCQGLAFYSRCQKQKKIYHSDIKPANILRAGGRYLVADFGSAQVIIRSYQTRSFFYGTLYNGCYIF